MKFKGLVERCYAALRAHGAVEPEQKEEICYGLDLLLFSLVSLLSLLAAGAAMGRFADTALYLFAFIPLQSFGGGYHAKTHLRCYLLMVCCLLLSLWLMRAVAMAGLLFAALLGGFIIFRLAPVQHPGAPFSERFGLRMRRIVRGVEAVLLACCLLFLAAGSPLAAPVCVALASSGVSLVAASRTEKRAP